MGRAGARLWLHHAQVLACLVTPLLGCCTSRPTARCSIIASPIGVTGGPTPPQLTIMARNPFAEPAALYTPSQEPGHCGPAPLPFDSPIDALTAVWVAHATVDGQARWDCPRFPTELSVETPQVTVPPCGVTACPNEQVAFGSDGVRVHVLFYDDPSQHRYGAGRETERPSGVCYYRVYAVSVSWYGKAPNAD